MSCRGLYVTRLDGGSTRLFEKAADGTKRPRPALETLAKRESTASFTCK